MIKRDLTIGLATMCIGGGMGEAIIVERDELCKSCWGNKSPYIPKSVQVETVWIQNDAALGGWVGV